MKRMAIIFNSDFHHWPMGGMISYVTHAVSMLSDHFEIELWGCAVDGRSPEPLAVDGISYRIHGHTKAKTQKKVIPNVVRCFWGNMVNSQEFRSDRYDILYFHLSASELGWFWGEKWKHPFFSSIDRPLVILHQHGMAYRKAIGDRLNYYAMDQADLVFFTTDKTSLERHRQHVKNPNILWMPSMVDTVFFHPVSPEEKQNIRKKLNIDPNKKVFLYTGRVTSWKNPQLLLEAFHLYQRSNDGNGYLILVGDGDGVSGARTYVKDHLLEDDVRLTGKQERQEVCAYLQASDVFVMPSKGEGVSISTLEAMAADLPVVAFAVEGMSGLVHEQCGILIQEQSSSAFAAGMEQAVKKQFRARAAVEPYSVERVRDRMVQAIENALKDKKT